MLVGEYAEDFRAKEGLLLYYRGPSNQLLEGSSIFHHSYIKLCHDGVILHHNHAALYIQLKHGPFFLNRMNWDELPFTCQSVRIIDRNVVHTKEYRLFIYCEQSTAPIILLFLTLRITKVPVKIYELLFSLLDTLEKSTITLQLISFILQTTHCLRQISDSPSFELNPSISVSFKSLPFHLLLQPLDPPSPFLPSNSNNITILLGVLGSPFLIVQNETTKKEKTIRMKSWHPSLEATKNYLIYSIKYRLFCSKKCKIIQLNRSSRIFAGGKRIYRKFEMKDGLHACMHKSTLTTTIEDMHVQCGFIFILLYSLDCLCLIPLTFAFLKSLCMKFIYAITSIINHATPNLEVLVTFQLRISFMSLWLPQKIDKHPFILKSIEIIGFIIINLFLHPQNYKQQPFSWGFRGRGYKCWCNFSVIHWLQHGNLHTLPPFLGWSMPIGLYSTLYGSDDGMGFDLDFFLRRDGSSCLSCSSWVSDRCWRRVCGCRYNPWEKRILLFDVGISTRMVGWNTGRWRVMWLNCISPMDVTRKPQLRFLAEKPQAALHRKSHLFAVGVDLSSIPTQYIAKLWNFGTLLIFLTFIGKKGIFKHFSNSVFISQDA
ncbi:hypothetical protein VP01_1919g2 [Puccinia sorghi]|uniref:Uncharacterized protein n=1 Tax=Puccinia sorghi TaxID=27349 RepID=A0A0L6VCJ8_9BASI|nr:hypothetical protein VP01_1919g2 [Puccinia sorghi]